MDDLLCISNDGEIRIVRYENDLAPFLGLLDERDQYFVNALVVKVVFRLVDNQWDKRRMLMEIGSMFAETTRDSASWRLVCTRASTFLWNAGSAETRSICSRETVCNTTHGF
jgi:hypothetical protein